MFRFAFRTFVTLSKNSMCLYSVCLWVFPVITNIGFGDFFVANLFCMVILVLHVEMVIGCSWLTD